jgi:hypothetical protein
MSVGLPWAGLVGGLWLALGLPAVHSDPERFVRLAKCDFETGRASEWRPRDPDHWRVAERDRGRVYELTAPGTPGLLRAPTSWSLWDGFDLGTFDFRGRLQSGADPANDKRDLCVVFHFQDPAHFYYVHFAASSDEVHNIIGLVNGADRVKINREPAGSSASRLTDRAWHDFRVCCDSATGEIQAYLDDPSRPILTARDRTLGHGLVGVGSFDDVGCFDDLELWVPKGSAGSGRRSVR